MSAAVVTFTAAGALDVTYRVHDLRPGELTRASWCMRELSGKGVNVSTALDASGIRTSAVVILGHDTLDLAGDSPQASFLRVVEAPGATRVNTSVIDSSGSTTKINAPIDTLPAEVWNRAVEEVVESLDEIGAGWLMLCGSMPQVSDGHDASVPADFTRLLDAARHRKVRVGVDSSGAGLRRLVSAPERPDLIKPNTVELAELTGRRLTTLGEVADAARELAADGVGVVFVSMGADGVLAVSGDTVVHAHAVPPRRANTAGAGDAALAGFLAALLRAEDAGTIDRLIAAASNAAAYGAHAVARSSTLVLDVDDLPQAAATVDPEPETPLSEPAAPSA